MKYDLKIDSKCKTVKVKVTCLLNQEVRKEILFAVVSQLGMVNFSKVLIDLRESRFDPTEPMAGAIELTNFMRFIGIKPHVKFAFIYSEAESHRKYFENVAQCDGLNFKYFKSINDAEVWLDQ